jgi:uncharacterized DUF497 family protein
MEFGWHAAKREKTLAERGVDFEDVVVGFSDPKRMVMPDVRRDYGEARYNMLARCEGRVFHITYTLRGDLTWIISARKANTREQRRYAQG